MKITWEEIDIWGGRIVGRPGRSERWMIGYTHNAGVPQQFTLTSMIDGMVNIYPDKKALAEHLTKANEWPEALLDQKRIDA